MTPMPQWSTTALPWVAGLATLVAIVGGVVGIAWNATQARRAKREDARREREESNRQATAEEAEKQLAELTAVLKQLHPGNEWQVVPPGLEAGADLGVERGIVLEHFDYGVRRVRLKHWSDSIGNEGKDE